MRKMGVEALYQKPRLSRPRQGHAIYPYLLKGVAITEANKAWATDITYLPMAKGFCFDRYDRRRHQGLDNRAPNEVYWSTLPEVRDIG
jgi:hypothetical protein